MPTPEPASGALSPNMATFRRLASPGEPGRELTPEEVVAARLSGFSPDLEISDATSLPQGGVHRGHGGWIDYHRIEHEHWSQVVHGHEVFEAVDDDVIVVRIDRTWTANATGRSVRMPTTEVLRFRDAVIAGSEVYHQDVAALLATLDGA